MPSTRVVRAVVAAWMFAVICATGAWANDAGVAPPITAAADNLDHIGSLSLYMSVPDDDALEVAVAGPPAVDPPAVAIPRDTVAVGARTDAPEAELAFDSEISAAKSSSYGGCTFTGSNDDVVTYKPMYDSGTWKNPKSGKNVFYAQFMFQVYKRNHARRLYDPSAKKYYDSKQWENCVVGGAKKYGDARLDRVMALAAMDDTGPRLLPGKGIWDSGAPSDSKAAATVSFSVDAGPASVGASVPIHNEGNLSGSIGPDNYDIYDYSPYHDNKVNTYWEGNGSANFEGQVGHGIWEYKQSDPNRGWYIGARVGWHCRFLGSC